MNKVLAQFDEIDQMKDFQSGYVFYMFQTVKSVERSRGGILLHFIAKGSQGIDFVCCSYFFTQWPDNISPQEAKAIIVAEYLPKVNQINHTHVYFRGLDLPSHDGANLVFAHEILKAK